MNYKIITISILSIFFFLNSNAESSSKNGYKIEVIAPSQKGNMAYLANYWQGQTYISDSIEVPKNGKFVFENKIKNLPTGQYLLFIKPDIQLELLIDEKEQEIKINLNSDNLLESTIKGSNDSKLFIEHVKEQNKLNAELEEYTILIQDEETKEDERRLAISSYKTKNKEINDFNNKQIENHKGTWFGTFVKAISPVSGPHMLAENEEQAKENIDYIRNHYFDNIDFTDNRMWHTSFFLQQVDNYLYNWIPQHPDTIAKGASWIVAKAQGNEDTFEKMLSYLTNQSLSSQSMGMENTWAKLAEDYIFDKENAWIDSTQYSNLLREYSLIELNRMGMEAQNLKLSTIDGDTINTNDIEAEYLLLYFYSTTCSYCDIEMPKLKNDFYLKHKDKGVKIVAINLEHGIDRWQAFIKKHGMEEWINAFDPNYKSEYWLKYNTSGTPSLYLLGKDKNILAKKINVDNLNTYFGLITK